MRRLIWTLLICLPMIPAGMAQEKPGGPEITPPNVFQRVALVRAEIDLIRLEMGKPQVDPPPIQVVKAAPREVYYQALTLFQKANRLDFQHTRELADEPAIPADRIRPADVHAVVDQALDRVRKVKEALGIAEQSDAPPVDPGIEPSDVFNAILAANRELNNLLNQRFAPNDVYMEVTRAIAYLSRLLDSAGEVSTPSEPPPFERRKRPADVYRKLVGCFDEIHRVGEDSGIPMLNLVVDDQQVESVEPSDVYDVASLLVSELAHLHSQRKSAEPPRKVYNPGWKLPSHVYQRIGILCGQMEALKRKVENNPDWLKD